MKNIDAVVSELDANLVTQQGCKDRSIFHYREQLRADIDVITLEEQRTAIVSGVIVSVLNECPWNFRIIDAGGRTVWLESHITDDTPRPNLQKLVSYTKDETSGEFNGFWYRFEDLGFTILGNPEGRVEISFDCSASESVERLAKLNVEVLFSKALLYIDQTTKEIAKKQSTIDFIHDTQESLSDAS